MYTSFFFYILLLLTTTDVDTSVIAIVIYPYVCPLKSVAKGSDSTILDALLAVVICRYLTLFAFT